MEKILFIALILMGLLGCSDASKQSEDARLSVLHDSTIDQKELEMIRFGVDDYIKSHDLDERNSVTISKLAELLYVDPELGNGDAKNFEVTRGLDNILIVSTPNGIELGKTPTLLNIKDFDTIKYGYAYLRTKKLSSLIPDLRKCDESDEVGNLVTNSNGIPFYCANGSQGIGWYTPSLIMTKE